MDKEILRKAQLIMKDILDEVDRVCRENDIEYFISDGTLLGAVRHKGFIPWDDDLDISMTRENFNKFLKIAPEKLKKEYFMQHNSTDKYYDLDFIPMKVRRNGTLLIENEYMNPKAHSGIYIDIFPLDKEFVNPKLRLKQEKLKRKYILLRIKPPKNHKSKSKYFVREIIYSIGKMIPMSYIRKNLYKTLEWEKDEISNRWMYGVDTLWNNSYNEKDIFPLKEIIFEGKLYPAPNNPHNVLKAYYGDYMVMPKEEDRFQHSKEIKLLD